MSPTAKKPLANGNGTYPPNYLSLINSGAIALIIAMFAGFWSLADPRGELKTIRENYLTLREHIEFASRLQLDTARLDKVNNDQWHELLSMREWGAWKLERDAAVVVLQKRLEPMVTRPELEASLAKQQVMLESLRREIDQIDKVVNARLAGSQQGQGFQK